MTPFTALFTALRADLLNRFPNLGNPALELANGPTRYACAYLLDGFGKKFSDHLSTKPGNPQETAALRTFLEANEKAGQYTRPRTETAEDEVLYATFKRVVYDFFHVDGDTPLIRSAEDILSKGDLGKGANQCAYETDFLSKLFISPLSVSSPSLYKAYRSWALKCQPEWYDAETRRRLYHGDGHLPIRKCGKLGFVPKNDRTARTTETQATLNTLYQRGISWFIERRLKQFFGIDMTTQPDLNRVLARRGSRWGVISTIDLSSASDYISLNLVRDVVPRASLSWLLLVTHRQTEIDFQGSKSEVELNMLSTMGNGFTSSFQTMLFACMVKAAYLCAGRRWKQSRLWGVFGDDIIVPTGNVSTNTCRLLRMCGFKINPTKTFVEGPFRESCGADFVHGVNVRPVFLTSLKTLASCYVAINRLNVWAAEHEVWIPNATRVLLDRIRMLSRAQKIPPFFVPATFGEDSGIWSVKPRTLRVDANGTPVVRHLIPIVSKIAVSGPVDRGDRRGRLYRLNSAGIYLAALRGSLQSSGPSSITPRNLSWWVGERGVDWIIPAMHVGVRTKDTTAYAHTRSPAPSWGAPPELQLERCRRHWLRALTS